MAAVGGGRGAGRGIACSRVLLSSGQSILPPAALGMRFGIDIQLVPCGVSR